MAMRHARQGPVFITKKGEPEYVLLTIHEYDRLIGKGKTIAEMLAMPEAAEIDFSVTREDGEFRPVDFD
jgi:prevent-host-death family protein